MRIKLEKHGLSFHPLYGVWSNMKSRCNKNNWKGFDWWSRGIKVCDEWNHFIAFYSWAIKNGYNKGLTIDRIDNNGNYEPSNCRFTSYSVNNSNTRNSVIYKNLNI